MNLFLSTYETHMRQEVEKAFGGTLCGQVMKQPKVCITRCVWVTRANHMIVRPVIRWVIELQTRGYKLGKVLSILRYLNKYSEKRFLGIENWKLT